MFSFYQTWFDIIKCISTSIWTHNPLKVFCLGSLIKVNLKTSNTRMNLKISNTQMLPHVLPLEMNFIIHAYSVRRVYVYTRRWGGNGIKNPGRREDEFFSKDARFRGNYNYVFISTILLYFFIYSFSPNDVIGQFEK